MKKTLKIDLKFTLLLSVILMVYSCKDVEKDSSAKEESTKEQLSTLTKFRGALSNLHEMDQKYIFNTLPNDVKAALWRDRLSVHIERTDNEKAKTVLQKLLEEFNSVTTFDSSNVYVDSMMRVNFIEFCNKIKPEIQEAYNNQEAAANNILYRLADKPKAEQIFNTAGGGLPPCNCNVKKDWCFYGDSCVAGNCKTSIAGCGPFWLEKCDGTCQ